MHSSWGWIPSAIYMVGDSVSRPRRAMVFSDLHCWLNPKFSYETSEKNGKNEQLGEIGCIHCLISSKTAAKLSSLSHTPLICGWNLWKHISSSRHRVCLKMLRSSTCPFFCTHCRVRWENTSNLRAVFSTSDPKNSSDEPMIAQVSGSAVLSKLCWKYTPKFLGRVAFLRGFGFEGETGPRDHSGGPWSSGTSNFFGILRSLAQ